MLDKAGPDFGEREPVANDEHLALLRQGTATWNEWRERNSSIAPDLREANLSHADLSGANLIEAQLLFANLIEAKLLHGNLIGAKLFGANLSGANLFGANLSGANLFGANLSGADLSGAELSKASLVRANLSGAELFEVDMAEAYLFETMFADVDLTTTKGLNECVCGGPSPLDFRTLTRSQNLPISFLRGCGLPDNVIEYLPSLFGKAIHFHSCFISYSAKDQVFANRLHADLQDKGVRCWFAPHDLPIGAKTWDEIDEAIRRRDKLLLILSKASIASEWVEDEVNKAYGEERSRNEIVLFPIRIDNTVISTAEPWAVKLRDQRNIGDFRQWRKPTEYQKSLDRLLRDLKASGAK
jgi:uncharacterized protein YjbI with pentapeptide repeats